MTDKRPIHAHEVNHFRDRPTPRPTPPPPSRWEDLSLFGLPGMVGLSIVLWTLSSRAPVHPLLWMGFLFWLGLVVMAVVPGPWRADLDGRRARK